MTDRERTITISMDRALRRRVDAFLVIVGSVAAVFVLPVLAAFVGTSSGLTIVSVAVAVGGLASLAASQRDRDRDRERSADGSR